MHRRVRQPGRRGIRSDTQGRNRERKPLKIDTGVRHATKPGANLFLELGFPPAEANRLYAASRQQINDLRRLKEQLTAELAGWIATHGLRQTDAAAILMVTRPRVSDVVNRKTAKFTIDALVEMLGRAGKCVSVAVR